MIEINLSITILDWLISAINLTYCLICLVFVPSGLGNWLMIFPKLESSKKGTEPVITDNWWSSIFSSRFRAGMPSVKERIFIDLRLSIFFDLEMPERSAFSNLTFSSFFQFVFRVMPINIFRSIYINV